jgi:hypothetical protein
MDLILQKVNAARLQMPEGVSEKLQWENQNRDYTICEPLEKLHAKYSQGATLLFDFYVFEYPHRVLDNLTSADLIAADRLMGANITAQNLRLEQLTEFIDGKKIERFLSKIPWEASIEDPQYDSDVQKALEKLVDLHGVELAIASKLLTIKRPFLIPMMDSMVQYCFHDACQRCSKKSEIPVVIMGEFRRLLQDEHIRMTTTYLCSEIRKEFGIRVSPIRVLDQLIWFDWNIIPSKNGTFVVRGFNDWIYDAKKDRVCHKKHL